MWSALFKCLIINWLKFSQECIVFSLMWHSYWVHYDKELLYAKQWVCYDSFHCRFHTNCIMFEFEFCTVWWHLVSIWTFGVMYPHTLFQVRKLPDLTSSKIGCVNLVIADAHFFLGGLCGYAWVNVHYHSESCIMFVGTLTLKGLNFWKFT